MTGITSRPVYATLMVAILVFGSLSAVFLVTLSTGGILGEYNFWAQAIPSDGTVKDEQKISDTAGNFTGVLDDVDVFGIGLAN